MPQSNELESLVAEPPYDAVLGLSAMERTFAFYETEEDLLDLVGQFCAAGAGGETCACG